MKKFFGLKFKDDPSASPIEIMEHNVHALETLCKQANKDGFQVILISPEKFEQPKNVYELSVILAEDLVMKFSDNNTVVRDTNP